MAVNNVGNQGAPNRPVVDGKQNAQQTTQNQTAQNATAQAQQQATARSAAQDSVSLTQSAQQLSQVQKKGSDAPVNQEKVDKLKKAIQSGEYKLDPEALAAKISKLESMLFIVK